MSNENETTPATVPAETVQAETTPDASVDAPAPGEAPKAPRKPSKGKGKGKGKVSPAQVKRMLDGPAKPKGAERVNHVAIVQQKVGKRRIVWQGKPLDWPKAARESGRRAEALLKAAGPKGLSYADYSGNGGSINRLGYMLRKEAAKLA